MFFHFGKLKNIMRIIHLVLGKANPDRMNGVNKLVYEMATTQHEMGMNVTLWGITENPDHNYPDRNFRTELFKMISNKLTIHKSLKKAINKLSTDTVFHLHGSFIPEFFHIGKLLKEKNISYVYTPHGALAPAALKRSGWKKQIYFKLFEKHLLKNAACMIATGKSVYDNVDVLITPQKKVLIPNGQDLITPFGNSEPKERMIFGFCGRIALEHKGLDLLLEGYSHFKKQGGNAELHLIGDGEEMPKFKEIARKLGVLEGLTLYGAQFGRDKFKLLSTFDVFVHTSRMEGFPAAVLEASAIGLPVMISRHTNIWDYIGKYKCGLLVEPNTPEEIGNQMIAFEKLYLANKLNPMSEGAKKMITQHFDWKAICSRLHDEYTSACGAEIETKEMTEVY